MRVVIIEDEPDTAEMYAEMMRLSGYEVVKYFASRTAIAQIAKQDPSVVILDLMMPDLDGFSILETMQGDSQLRNIPVIILTEADLTPEDRSKITKHKREVLMKDEFKSQQLINHLESVLLELNNTDKDQPDS